MTRSGAPNACKYSGEQRNGGNTLVVFPAYAEPIISRPEEAKLSYGGKGFCGFPAPQRIATNQDRAPGFKLAK
jgi:hypothetical protein